MPEKGWYSLTVRKSTAERVRGLAKENGKTVDKYLNYLIDRPNTVQEVVQESASGSKGKYTVCSLCGARVKNENFERHMSRVHPKDR